MSSIRWLCNPCDGSKFIRSLKIISESPSTIACMIPVRSQFVVQTYSMVVQWAQDNKFVESGLENWALVNLGNNYHKFKENLN